MVRDRVGRTDRRDGEDRRRPARCLVSAGVQPIARAQPLL
jgi:hypothetical protein